MTLQFLPPTLSERLPPMWRTFLASKTSRLAVLLLIFLLLSAIIFRRYWTASNVWKPKSMGQAGATDPTRPDTNAAPVDLTTLGADVDLSLDHPLRKMNGGTPASISPHLNGDWDNERIGTAISEIELRLDKIERFP